MRFADHSCAPSGEMTAWRVDGLQCLAVTASREMQAGEKLTLDLSPAMKVSLHLRMSDDAHVSP